MLSKIKLALGGLTAALIALLGLWGKYQSNRADNEEERANEAESEAMNANQRAESQVELNKVKSDSEKQKVEDEKAIQQIKDSKVRPDYFSSNSMFDD